MKRLIIAVALLVSSQPSFTENSLDFNKGSGLLEYCNALLRGIDGEKVTQEEINKAGVCIGYITGFNSYNNLVTNFNTNLFCPPSGVYIGILVRVVVKYLKDNPAYLHQPSSGLTISALMEAYPCKEESKE